jgi:hypothetical protein
MPIDGVIVLDDDLTIGFQSALGVSCIGDDWLIDE